MSNTALIHSNKCPVCDSPATKRCARCKSVYYCSPEHQRSDWKRHKRETCDKVVQDSFQADQYTLHKQAFDQIIQKYHLNTEAKSTEISEFLTDTSSHSSVSPQMFAEKFGTTEEEAAVFLGWINVGVKFKEESLDVAKQSGLGGR